MHRSRSSSRAKARKKFGSVFDSMMIMIESHAHGLGLSMRGSLYEAPGSEPHAYVCAYMSNRGPSSIDAIRAAIQRRPQHRHPVQAPSSNGPPDIAANTGSDFRPLFWRPLF